MDNKKNPGSGGNGGSATVNGNGIARGGNGGNAGVYGIGGDGGSAEVNGDVAFGLAVGGDGGGSGTADGRGGRGARGPFDKLGISSDLWGFGSGGDGQNAAEYERRLVVLKECREKYFKKFSHKRKYVEAGIDQVPIDWINQCLSENGESWSVAMGHDGYVLPPLNTP